jgi:hypothetical protein
MNIRLPDPNPAVPVRDLGEIGETLLVCGGAYSNLEAFSALMAAAARHGIPASRMIHTGESVFADEFAAAAADVIIGGHSGLPFTRRFGNRVWHNSGALGMPANDGTPCVWYSLVVPESGGRIRFEHHALGYDHERAREKMLAAGLPGGYADALVTGKWPSLDVLPDAKKRLTGQPIDVDDLNTAAREAAFATG